MTYIKSKIPQNRITAYSQRRLSWHLEGSEGGVQKLCVILLVIRVVLLRDKCFHNGVSIFNFRDICH